MKYKISTADECTGNDICVFWTKNNRRHRLYGPIIEWPDGSREWYKNGKPHRLGGPAWECINGHKEWCINGKQYTKEDYLTKYEI